MHTYNSTIGLEVIATACVSLHKITSKHYTIITYLYILLNFKLLIKRARFQKLYNYDIQKKMCKWFMTSCSWFLILQTLNKKFNYFVWAAMYVNSYANRVSLITDIWRHICWRTVINIYINMYIKVYYTSVVGHNVVGFSIYV